MDRPKPLQLLEADPALAGPVQPAWSAGSELPAMLARFFAVPPKENVWRLAEKTVVLDAKQSPGNPGPYRASTAPHTRFIQEKFTDPTVRQITIKKNSQGGYTEAVLNCIRYCVEYEPRNVLYVIDSLTEARRVAKIRLLPTLLRNPGTAQAFSEDANDRTGLTLNMRDMFMMFAGGGSIGAVANKPIELGVVDEADKIPRITGGHGHVVHEMKARFKTVESMKLFVLSAPNEEQDVTTTEYRSGSQHKYFCPCPHCGQFQELIQERVRFDHCKNPDGEYDQEKVLREAYYLCERGGTEACPDGKIHDHHKPAMSDRAEWRQTNPNAEPGHISVESSDLFSLFKDASFGRIALDIIGAIKNPMKRRSVQRDRFGLEWRQRRAEIKYEDLLMLKGKYKRGEVPVRGVYTALCSDLQGPGPRWVKAVFDVKGDVYVSDYGDPLSLDDLTAQAAKPVIETMLGRERRELFVVGGLIDEGFKQSEVLSFCLRDATNANSGVLRFLPAKGRGNIQNAGALVVASPRKHEGIEFDAYHFNDDKFKADLYISRIKEFDRIKKGLSKVPRIWLPQDVGSDLMDELMGEQLVPEINQWGHTRYIWKETGPNHYGDALKLLLVLWQVVGGEVLAAVAADPEPAQAA